MCLNPVQMDVCFEFLFSAVATPATRLRNLFRKRRHSVEARTPSSPPPPPDMDSVDNFVDWEGSDAEWLHYKPFVKGERQEPLAPKLTDVNAQLSSLLFNGRIPSEIRNHIFEFVLTEDTRAKLYESDNHYSRPDYRAKKNLLTNLLLTCRRVYLEAHHLPLINKEHVFWHEREPDGMIYEDEEEYFARFRPDQLELVRRVHLFTQQYWLEGYFQRVCKLEVMQTIEKLKITLRRGDWWFWENSADLGINPQRGSADVSMMEADWRAEAEGEVIEFRDHAWGSAFQHIRDLKELEMEFETSIYEEEELKRIVEHAKKWRFPMGEGRVLTADGQVVRKSMWRGPMIVWSSNCPECGNFNGNVVACKICKERADLMKSQLGPMLVVFSLKWKLALADTRL